MPRIHTLERQQRIELPIAEVFDFYGDARNLERITPPWLGFEVTTPGPIEMGVGTSIEYRLRLHRVPVRWRTRIGATRWRGSCGRRPYGCCITASVFPDGSLNQAICGPGPRTMPFSS